MVEVLSYIFGEEAENEIAVLLQHAILAAVAVQWTFSRGNAS